MAQQLTKHRILIIVPAYNEEKNIRGVIKSLRRTIPTADILVVNDCSKDNTSSAARETDDAIVIDLPVNLGIGGGVQTGFLYAFRNGYDIAIQFDGDGQHKAEEIPGLLRPIIDGTADAVIGSRFLQKKSFRSTFLRRAGIWMFRVINSLLIRQKITDNTSGFRGYNRKAISLFSEQYPSDYPEPEAVILLGRNRMRIAEIPVYMDERQGGESSISGLKSAYYMVKVLFAIVFAFIRSSLAREG